MNREERFLHDKRDKWYKIVHRHAGRTEKTGIFSKPCNISARSYVYISKGLKRRPEYRPLDTLVT